MTITGFARAGTTLAAVVALLGTPAITLAQTAAQIEGAAASYQVGPGDDIAISVYGVPDLATRVTVTPSGKIDYPVLGSVDVNNLTASEISALVAKQLKAKGVVLNPSVNVQVAAVRAKVVSVMGAVARPGPVALDRAGMTLAEVLARAGATFGSGSGVVTVMNGATKDQRDEFRLADLVSGRGDRPARPGEMLVVQAAPSVYVSGEVGRPGAYPLEVGMTVGQAIAVGGGVTPRGSANRIRVTRKQPDGTTRILDKVNADTQLVADDLVTVRTRVF